jgi:hypothetical protein
MLFQEWTTLCGLFGVSNIYTNLTLIPAKAKGFTVRFFRIRVLFFLGESHKQMQPRHFHLEKEIGIGSFSSVWIARAKHNEQTFAGQFLNLSGH